MTRRIGLAGLNLFIAATLTASCAGVKKPVAPTAPPPAGATMWVEPPSIEERDLFYGPWGEKNAPNPAAVYSLVERKHTGVNLGMTVKDSEGREWSVKQAYPGGVGPESQVEVALSRVLSAVGYHQAPVYYLPAFTLKDDFGTHVEAGGRFRLKDFDWTDEGIWSWDDSPFVGTKPYQGLIVLLTMFNSTDLKASNNTLYETKGDKEKLYAVRDIGAALGDEQKFAPAKNDIDEFEKTPFILGVQNGFVQFAYKGWYKNLTRDRIMPEDAKWAGDLLGRLSDKQWNDAFRAAGYEPAIAVRFISKLRERIAQAQSLTRNQGR